MYLPGFWMDSLKPNIIELMPYVNQEEDILL